MMQGMNATETLVIPVSREEKERIEARARAAHATVGDLVREALELWELEDRAPEIDGLVAEMERSTARAGAALDDAIQNVRQLLDELAARRNAR